MVLGVLSVVPGNVGGTVEISSENSPPTPSQKLSFLKSGLPDNNELKDRANTVLTSTTPILSSTPKPESPPVDVSLSTGRSMPVYKLRAGNLYSHRLVTQKAHRLRRCLD